MRGVVKIYNAGVVNSDRRMAPEAQLYDIPEVLALRSNVDVHIIDRQNVDKMSIKCRLHLTPSPQGLSNVKKLGFSLGSSVAQQKRDKKINERLKDSGFAPQLRPVF
jgi:hypothetical protein